jgi:tetratricopeptide (TPR) repeat protein
MNDYTVTGGDAVRIVLDRLNVDSDGRLLELDRGELDQLYRQVDAIAQGGPDRQGLAEDDRLYELLAAASEGRGDPALAAALCVLAHDRRMGDEDPRSRYVRVVLRWQLGHALFLMAEKDEENLRRCLRLVRGSLRQAEALWRAEGVSRDSFFSLIFELQSWLGHRHEALGEYQAAVDAFSAAAIAARTKDDYVAYTARTASAMATLGETQKAYELLMLAEDQLGEVEDELARQLWEACYGSLRSELGSHPRASGRQFNLKLLEEVSQLSRKALTEDVSLVQNDGTSVPGLIEALRKRLDGVPEDDFVLRHGLNLELAVLSFSLRRETEAEACLRDAESLESCFPEELPKLRRRIVRARGRARFASTDPGAWELFAELLPEVERLLEDRERLSFLADFLVCLIPAKEEPARAWILDLSERGGALFERLLDSQPGAPGRRSVRDTHQRFFEAALIALLSAAQQTGESSERGQELLEMAWSLTMTGRSPELRSARAIPDADVLRCLRQREDAFHRALRDQLVLGGAAEGDGWASFLDRVFEFELAVVRSPRLPGTMTPAPPLEGIALSYFQVRDLSAAHPLIVLGRHDGRFTAHVIPEQTLGLLPGSRKASAPFARWRDVGGPAAATWRLGCHFGELLPPEYALLRTRKGGASPKGTGQPLFPSPWFLFLDGALSALPLEMLPEAREQEICFGQGRAVHLCLRPAVPAAWGKRLDFSRGWLGLGGVPGSGRISELPGSLEEVRNLQGRLRDLGHPAEILTGREATASALRERIAVLRPAVLHVAAHGSANADYPEACTLILAADPGQPEGELLPFRRIRDLDLSEIGLVVLSACKSLLGHSGRGAAMEGLAWAFLQAGAAQVIASRYAVDDRETARFMAVLYNHLQSHPVAEALGRARDECLCELRMDPEHVAAWSVWS